LLPAVQGVCGNSPFLKHVIVIGQREGYQSYAAWIAGRPTTFETAPTHRNDFCSLNYSSGTTGEPKGILHAHKDYLLTAQWWGVNG
jgi:acyl-coenzyme A synthetase/AMP-(fatty) acid ligase